MGASVSIVVAVYKVADYVEQCVRSLYGQTLENLEIILVDDCSPDDSIDIALRALEDFPQRKEQVRVIRHEQNMDLPQTRWDGIMAARGEYIIFIDGDDYVDTRMAELLYNRAMETDADMVVCDHWLCAPNNKYIRVMGPHGENNLKSDIINLRVPVNIWCKLIRRSVFTDNNIVWPARGYAEDVIISTVTAYYARRIAYVPEPLYYYRFNPDSYSRGMDVQRRLSLFKDYITNQQILLQFMEREGMLEKYEEGVFKGKMRVKKHLLPLFPERKYVRLYFKTFPEIDRAFLCGNKYRKPTYRERVWVIALWLGLYPRQKRRLFSKRFRPRLEWLP